MWLKFKFNLQPHLWLTQKSVNVCYLPLMSSLSHSEEAQLPQDHQHPQPWLSFDLAFAFEKMLFCYLKCHRLRVKTHHAKTGSGIRRDSTNPCWIAYTFWFYNSWARLSFVSAHRVRVRSCMSLGTRRSRSVTSFCKFLSYTSLWMTLRISDLL